MDKTESPQQIVRLSLGWLFLGVVSMLALGIAGGILGQQLLQPQLPPLTGDSEQLFTTIQEVTISPNIAAREMIQRSERSVVLLGRAQGEGNTILGTGLVVTNDGLVITAIPLTGSVVAIDSAGRRMSLNIIGQDEIYGLSYARIADSVVVPRDLRRDDPVIGERLLALTRNPVSFTPAVEPYLVRDYELANEYPSGVQRIAKGSSVVATAIGAPVLDEEGRVAGLIANTETGDLLPVTAINSALDRLTKEERERDPFTELGFDVSYSFTTIPEEGVVFGADVVQVRGRSAAAVANLRRGDRIIAINDERLDWQNNILRQLSPALPITLTVLRNDRQETITLRTIPANTPTP